jgi:hypothetical protein
MEEQTQPQQPEVSQAETMYKIYIAKLENLLAETQRRMLSTEMNLEMATNQNKQHADTISQQANYISQANIALDNLAKERNQLKDQVTVHNASDAEVSSIKRERDAAVKIRDDYQRELQAHIATNNKLNGKLAEALTTINEQQNVIDKFNASSDVVTLKAAKRKRD